MNNAVSQTEIAHYAAIAAFASAASFVTTP
jgi:hypothetical protein